MPTPEEIARQRTKALKDQLAAEVANQTIASDFKEKKQKEKAALEDAQKKAEKEHNETEAKPLIEKWHNLIKELEESGMRGYDNWNNGMLKIMQTFMAAADALSVVYGNHGYTIERAINSTLETIPKKAHAIKHGFLRGLDKVGLLPDSLVTDFTIEENNRMEKENRKNGIPTLRYHFTVDANGALNANANIDGEPLEADKHLKSVSAAASLWVIDQGYTPVKQGNNPTIFLRERDNKVLTQSDFDDLNVAAGTNNVFNSLIQQLGIPVKEEPRPRPAAPGA